MKRIVIFSVLALSLSMASCTQDGLGTETETFTPQADTGGQTGHTPTPPPPPPPPNNCVVCP